MQNKLFSEVLSNAYEGKRKGDNSAKIITNVDIANLLNTFKDKEVFYFIIARNDIYEKRPWVYSSCFEMEPVGYSYLFRPFCSELYVSEVIGDIRFYYTKRSELEQQMVGVETLPLMVYCSFSFGRSGHHSPVIHIDTEVIEDNVYVILHADVKHTKLTFSKKELKSYIQMKELTLHKFEEEPTIVPQLEEEEPPFILYTNVRQLEEEPASLIPTNVFQLEEEPASLIPTIVQESTPSTDSETTINEEATEEIMSQPALEMSIAEPPIITEYNISKQDSSESIVITPEETIPAAKKYIYIEDSSEGAEDNDQQCLSEGDEDDIIIINSGSSINSVVEIETLPESETYYSSCTRIPYRSLCLSGGVTIVYDTLCTKKRPNPFHSQTKSKTSKKLKPTEKARHCEIVY